MLVAPFNDLETTSAIIEQYASQLAGVIVEPLQRCVPPQPGFLEGLRKVTEQHQVLLIFDEVVTGFRLLTVVLRNTMGLSLTWSLMEKRWEVDIHWRLWWTA